MTLEWRTIEPDTYQGHVIDHVIGSAILGSFQCSDSILLLLNIGLVWTVYADLGMGLAPQSFAIASLEVDPYLRTALGADIDRLQHFGLAADGLGYFKAAPAECPISEAVMLGANERRLLLLRGDDVNLAVESSLATGEIQLTIAGDNLGLWLGQS